MKISKYLAGVLALALFSCGDPAEPEDPQKDVPEDKPEEYVDGTKVIDGRNAIDLGTGILWAEYNIGASAPHEYGYYYSWGEVEPKKSYTWENYKWCDGTRDIMTKYCMFKVYGNKDDKKVLDKEDDAAYVNWGSKWRMPTVDEVSALLQKCEWNWIRVEGIYGYEISSKQTGKSIFIPAAGTMTESSIMNSIFLCNYWTSSLFAQNEQYYAYSYAYLTEKDEPYQSNVFRYLGMTIRPVADKN